MDSGHLQHDVAAAVELLAQLGVFSGTDVTAEVPLRIAVAGAEQKSRTLYVAWGDDAGPGSRALLGEAAAIAARSDARVVAIAPSSYASRLASWGADALLTAACYDPRPLSAALATDTTFAVSRTRAPSSNGSCPE